MASALDSMLSSPKIKVKVKVRPSASLESWQTKRLTKHYVHRKIMAV